MHGIASQDTSCISQDIRITSETLLMVFMGHGFTSEGQESGSVFSAAVCKIQATKRYVESLVLKDKRSCFSQDEGSPV